MLSYTETSCLLEKESSSRSLYNLSTKTSPRLLAVQTNRQQILTLAQDADITNVRLFGSVARGDDVDGSDIDFLVDYHSDAGLFPLLGFTAQLETLLGFTVDVAPISMLKPNVITNALREARDL